MNPIFAREWRARWREARSFWLLFALVLVLGLVSGWIYYSAVTRVQYISFYNRTTMMLEVKPLTETLANRASRTGRELFQSLAIGNCIVCLFLAPALAAPSIARERERGLLESLQLSHMHPQSQVIARYLSSVVFLLAIQLSTLPMYGIVLFLGGVSPGELGVVSLLILMTLLLGAAIGLWFSARSYRPSSALFGALVAIAVWSGYSVWMAMGAASGSWDNFWLAALHPAVLMQFFINPQSSFGPGSFAFGTAPFGTTSLKTIAANCIDALRILCALYSALILAMLWSAIRKVNAPLPYASWQGRNRWVEKWKAQQEARREAAKTRREQARLGEQVQGALVADLPVEKLVRFRNPLLSREVKGRFRLRKANFFISALRIAGFVVGVSGWLGVLFALCDPISASRDGIGGSLVATLWALGVASVCALAATSFAREKESGTWEGLRLALLRPREIVRSKWLSVLISYAYYTAPLWLLLPLAMLRGNPNDINTLLFSIALAIASMAAFCAFGLWVSWRSSNPTTALAWTLGVAFTLILALPQIERLGGLERQITFARYGVAPIGEDYWSNGNEERERVNWMQEAGRQAASRSGSYTMSAYGGGDWNDFYTWRIRRKEQGREFWLWLNVWQPVQTYSLLFPPSESYRYATYMGSTADALESRLTFPLAFTHLVMALGACLLFLGMVRFEVARQKDRD